MDEIATTTETGDKDDIGQLIKELDKDGDRRILSS